MRRNRKKPPIAETKTKQAARDSAHTQIEQLPPEDSSPLSPDQPHPQGFSDSIKEQLQAARSHRTVSDGDSVTRPDHGLKETYSNIWRRLGFYSDHPNHNGTAIDEVHIKSMMEGSHKLGKLEAKYRLFINKPIGKRAMLMQYPNRRIDQEYRATCGNKPLEIRIKPKCGLVEVDIPVNIYQNYDKGKGVEYGEAVRKSRLLQEGSSYSLGGGLGIGPQPKLRDDSQIPPEGPSPEKLLENFDDANNKGHVMNKITLGGQIYPLKNGDPIYMAATFKEGEHVDSICHKIYR